MAVDADDASSELIARLLQEDQPIDDDVVGFSDQENSGSDDGDFLPKEVLRKASASAKRKKAASKVAAPKATSAKKARGAPEESGAAAPTSAPPISVAELVARGILVPGPDAFTLNYAGRDFSAALNADGTITSPTGQTFVSPSAWSIHCKRSVNPTRQADDGWKSVRFRGKDLHSYKVLAAAQQSGSSSAAAGAAHPKRRSRRSSDSSESDADSSESDSDKPSSPKKSFSQASDSSKSSSRRGARVRPLRESDLPASVRSSLAAGPRESQERRVVKPSVKFSPHEVKDMNPHTMFQCEMIKPSEAPFTLTVDPAAMAVMDMHSHLAHTEIIGYLGGTWDPDSRSLHVCAAFPCQPIETGHSHHGEGEDIEDDRTRNVEMDPESELQVRQQIQKERMVIVGWYHSHPTFQPDPSVRDVENQTAMQRLFRCDDSGLYPFVGIIVGPYSRKVEEMQSIVKCFIVMPSGEPMLMPINETTREPTPRLFDIAAESLKFIKQSPDKVYLDDLWMGASRREKMRTSAMSRIPKEHAEAAAVRVNAIVDAF